jgi:hypothetical protein
LQVRLSSPPNATTDSSMEASPSPRLEKSWVNIRFVVGTYRSVQIVNCLRSWVRKTLTTKEEFSLGLSSGSPGTHPSLKSYK